MFETKTRLEILTLSIISFLIFCKETENTCYLPILVPANGLFESFITPFCEPHIYNLNNFIEYDLLEWSK